MRSLVAIGLLVLLGLGAVLALRLDERDVGTEAPARAAQPRVVEGEAFHEPLEVPSGPVLSGSSDREQLGPSTHLQQSVIEAVGPGLSLSGSVRDDLGTPLFFFHARGEVRGPELEQRQIEPDGRFTLSGFEDGKQRVEFSAPGHETSSQVLEFPLVGEHKVVLRRLSQLSGTVVDAAGAPAEGVYLTVCEVSTQFPRQLPAAITDAAGEFEFDAPVGNFSVRVGFAGAPLLRDLQFELAPGQRVTDLVVRLRLGGVIEGLVHPRVGAGPTKGAPVSAVSEGFRKLGFTDAGGRFRIEGLAAGEYTVSVGSTAVERGSLLGVEGTRSGSLQSRRVSAEVVEGTVTHVEIGEPGELLTRVRGRVTLNGAPMTGEPPDKGLLSARREGSAAREDSGKDSWEGALLNLDSEGRFALAAVPGLWRFELRPLQRRTGFGVSQSGLLIARTVEIPASAEFDLELRLETGSISGRVRATTGDALRGFHMTLSGGDERDRVTHTVRAGFGGTYLFRGLPAGRYTLGTRVKVAFDGAKGPTLVDESIEDVLVSAGFETSNVDFMLRPGGGVRLESSASETDLGQTVLRLSNGVQSVECSYSARLQRFIATGLEPGPYDVTVASGPLVLAATVSVNVAPGTWAQAVLELEAPRRR